MWVPERLSAKAWNVWILPSVHKIHHSQASWFLSLQFGLILSEMFWFFQAQTPAHLRKPLVSMFAAWFTPSSNVLILPSFHKILYISESLIIHMFAVWFDSWIVFQESTKSITSQNASWFLFLKFHLTPELFWFFQTYNKHPLHLRKPHNLFVHSLVYWVPSWYVSILHKLHLHLNITKTSWFM